MKSIVFRFESIHVKKVPIKDLEMDEHITQTMRRLRSQGLTNEGEEKIARLKDVLLKVNASRTRYISCQKIFKNALVLC